MLLTLSFVYSYIFLMKSASTEAATKKRIVLDIFVIVSVSLQISCFIVILIQIPAKGLIPGL